MSIDFILNDFYSNRMIIPFGIVTLFQLILLFGLYGKLAFYKRKDEFGKIWFPSVSVIITAKNEDDNLLNNLPILLSQDYPEYEVVVVDDQSEDGSYDLLKAMSMQYPNLSVVTIGQKVRYREGKKLAISLGIKRSKYSFLLFTDADCTPASDQWIRLIMRNYSESKEIVLGFSPYKRLSSVLNLLIQTDTFFTALNYFSFAMAGMPYMGVGRNLSYRKELFLNKGFASQLHVPFGDDDLFVNENATKSNIALELDPNSFMISEPHTRFRLWLRQKRRHLKAGKEYKSKHKFWLGIPWISLFLFYAAFAFSLVLNPLSYFIWAIFAIRLIVSLIIFGLSLKKLKMTWLVWFVPFIEPIFQFIFLPLITLAGRLSGKNSW